MAWGVPIVDVAADYTEIGVAVEEAVLRVLRSEWAFSSERACEELGYTLTPLEEAVRRTLRG